MKCVSDSPGRGLNLFLYPNFYLVFSIPPQTLAFFIFRPVSGSLVSHIIVHIEMAHILSVQVSLTARQLMYRLLHRDPKNRMGSCEGANEIKQHPFFNGINWALVRCMVRSQPLYSQQSMQFLSTLFIGRQQRVSYYTSNPF